MSERVLLVEDTEHIVRTVTMCLSAHGYEVRVAGDGLTAVEEAIHWDPALILLDLLLPKMNGYLVLEALKQDPRTSGIPVLVMSAKAQEQDIKLARSLGAVDYLVKPFHPKQLVQIIRSTLTTEGACE